MRYEEAQKIAVDIIRNKGNDNITEIIDEVTSLILDYEAKLNKIEVNNYIAIEYAEFCVRCDREKLPLLCLDDYIKQYYC